MNKSDFINLSHREIIARKLTNDGCSEHEVKEIQDIWAETQKLIPEDFDELRDSSVCCFCVEDTLAPTG
ncbi:MAG: hypothetical protein AB1Z19_03190, partial [Eubacteriales bacterium]